MKDKVTGAATMDLPRGNYAQLNLPSFYGEVIPPVDEERAVHIFYHDFNRTAGAGPCVCGGLQQRRA